jgi:hypothetical protein
MSIDKPTVWPAGCVRPRSCGRHGTCMYMGCPHTGKDIQQMQRAVWKPWDGKDSRGYDMKKRRKHK